MTKDRKKEQEARVQPPTVHVNGMNPCEGPINDQNISKGSSDFGVGYAITMAEKLPWRMQGSVVGASPSGRHPVTEIRSGKFGYPITPELTVPAPRRSLTRAPARGGGYRSVSYAKRWQGTNPTLMMIGKQVTPHTV